MKHKQEWGHLKNILCIRLDSMGDVLMMTPAIRALKETHPSSNVTLLASQSGAEVSPLIPEIDDTMVYDPPWMKHGDPQADRRTDFQMIDKIKIRGFDAAVIFTTFSQSPLPAAFLTSLAGIPLRLACCRENPYYLLTDWVPETDNFGQAEIRHEVRRQLDLVGSIGCRTTEERLSLEVPVSAFEIAHDRVNNIGIDLNKPWLILHPGATAPSRRYPAERFREVAETLSCRHGFQIVLTGMETEIDMIEQIRGRVKTRAFSLAGKLNLPELSALISLAPLILTNNTGPAHIAAALGTPIVDLYALTNPQHTPWQVRHRILYRDVPCKYCYKSVCPMGHHDCLRLVSPGEVVNAALELFRAVDDQEKLITRRD